MRTRIPAVAALALPWIAACAGGSGSTTSGPPVLGYAAEGPEQRSYRLADTVSLDLDMGGQVMDVGIRGNALLDMAFEPVPEGVQVTTSWRDLAVTMSNPMGPPERATEEDVEGPLVFTLDRRGSAELVSGPTLTGLAPRMVVPEEVVEAFFPRLTGTPPTPGMSWTDTIAYASQASEARTVNETVVTYTVAGDTLVNGRSLLRIDMDGAGSMLQEGVTQGMDFVQDLTGGVEGFILWDLAGGEMVYRTTESSYSGSMTVTAAPFPLGVSLRGVSHIQLVENGGGG